MATIGIFDSGVGGLSVFREIRRLLPAEKYIYYADTAFCPYGDKSNEKVIERACAITDLLLSKGADVIVVACNTATGAAIAHLREHYPVRFIGMEPAIKPAADLTRSGIIGVLATAGTLKSDKYLHHKAEYDDKVTICENVGRGFVELVESGEISGSKAECTVRESLQPLLDAGADTIVLGCTHYPFLRDCISSIAGPEVTIIDPAPAVARQLVKIIGEEGIPLSAENSSVNRPELLSSGDPELLERAYNNYL